MRVGKTQMQIGMLAKSLNEGQSVFIAGMKDPKDYIDRLARDFNIIVITTPHYIKPSESNRFHLDGDKLTEYLPILTGYEFKTR